MSWTGKTEIFQMLKKEKDLAHLQIWDFDHYYPDRFFEEMEKDKSFWQQNRDKVEQATVQNIINSELDIFVGLILNKDALELLKSKKYEFLALVVNSKIRKERINKRSKNNPNRVHELNSIRNTDEDLVDTLANNYWWTKIDASWSKDKTYEEVKKVIQ